MSKEQSRGLGKTTWTTAPWRLVGGILGCADRFAFSWILSCAVWHRCAHVHCASLLKKNASALGNTAFKLAVEIGSVVYVSSDHLMQLEAACSVGWQPP